GEDTQNFRAITERSALPDYAKDGGIASIAPALTAQWIAAETAQLDLDHMTATQLSRLRALGANWVVLRAQTKTTLECPYRNMAVQVCGLDH
ncbi:MAG TPA: hypothetical protein VHN81_04655, partial [Edaphobacter sp.]|nr:hypothetical protein [Edaphobacter sp.]